MNIKTIILGGAALAISATALPALAHHSYAMFDEDKKVTVVGTIKEFQWTNPHSWIHVVVADANGKPEVWSVEAGAPGGLARQGFLPKIIVPGDKVAITLHPLRSGRPGGSFMAIKLPNGKTLGNPNGRAGAAD